jgi:FkbM family methyltransferase
LSKKILRRLLRRWWNIRHASLPPHWVLQPCGRSKQILLRSNAFISEIIYSQSYEPDEELYIANSLKEGMTVFDIGANIGLTTILMAQAVGANGRIYSFEPSPPTFRQLQLNINLNGLWQVSVKCLALNNVSGLIPFHVFPEGFEVYNSIGARERVEGLSADQVIHVPAITLDEYCQENNIISIDFLKIDVEGAEELVLIGAQRILKQNPQLKIMIELYEPSARQCGSSIAACLELFQKLDFYPHALTPAGGIVALSQQDYQLIDRGEYPKHNFVFQQEMIPD